MYLYRAVSESLFCEEVGSYVSYGIELTRDGKIIDHVSDVTRDERMAHSLAALFNLHQLSPIHFHDAIDDFLFDNKLDLQHMEDP